VWCLVSGMLVIYSIMCVPHVSTANAGTIKNAYGTFQAVNSTYTTAQQLYTQVTGPPPEDSCQTSWAGWYALLPVVMAPAPPLPPQGTPTPPPPPGHPYLPGLGPPSQASIAVL
jgi:hypothetical protein